MKRCVPIWSIWRQDDPSTGLRRALMPMRERTIYRIQHICYAKRLQASDICCNGLRTLSKDACIPGEAPISIGPDPLVRCLRGDLAIEPFSSCVCLTDLQCVDGLGELA